MVQEWWDFPLKEHSANIKTWSGSMMFWGCFSSVGTGELIAIRGMMKSDDCIKTLDENLNYQCKILIGNLLSSKIMIPNVYKSVTAWLQKRITVLPWPSMNFNLNPIENLWQKFKVWINRHSLKHLQELECVTIEERKKISEKTCSNLIKNFW